MFTLHLKLGCAGLRPHADLTLISTFEMRERCTRFGQISMNLRDDAVKWTFVRTDKYYCKHTRTESNFLRHSGIFTHGEREKAHWLVFQVTFQVTDQSTIT